MPYTVEITDAALADAENYILFLRNEQRELEYANRWWNGLVDTILSLEIMPVAVPSFLNKIISKRNYAI